MRAFVLAFALVAAASAVFAQEAPAFRAELVFPLRGEHNHASGVVECSNGDLIASWYRGHGERTSDDVAVVGARLRNGQPQWSETFLMADYPGFPDCNTCMMIGPDGRLWLFWPIIIAHSWESAITQFLYTSDYLGDGAPKWAWGGAIYLKPADFKAEMLTHIDDLTAKLPPERRVMTERRKRGLALLKEHLGQELYQRLGWQPRCKPTVLPVSERHPQGRIHLPLYSDTFSLGIMAISDDNARTWYASKPIFCYGAIQPSVLCRNDGTLVAYMRDNGGSGHIKVSESKDDGITWGPGERSELKNPGAGIDGVRLANGHWCMVYNDASRGRNSLAASISEDEGKTWKHTRHLEKHKDGSYHYPCVIQGRDGTIHSVYSYSVKKEDGKKGGESMKHSAFNEAWVNAGDQ
jgi:predicted neuraminidase